MSNEIEAHTEYGVMHSRVPDELWRGPWQEHEVDEWIAEFELDSGLPGTFIKVHREVGAWGSDPVDGIPT